MSKDAGRIHLRMDAEAKEGLEDLMDRTKSPTMVAVIRKSLKVYDYMLTEFEKGGKLQIVREDGTLIDVVIL